MRPNWFIAAWVAGPSLGGLLVPRSAVGSASDGPERAAQALGLVPHVPADPPAWAEDAQTLSVKTTDGRCVLFVASSDAGAPEVDGMTFTHRASSLSVRPSSAMIRGLVFTRDFLPPPWHGPFTGSEQPNRPSGEGGANATLYLATVDVDPEGRSTVREMPPLGPWFFVSSGPDHARLESVVLAWHLPTWQMTACDRASLRALRAVPLWGLPPLYPIEGESKVCIGEGAPAMWRYRVGESARPDAYPQQVVLGRVDCRTPCPPFAGGESPWQVPQGPEERPLPFFRDPEPEVFMLYRTQAACEADGAPGLYPDEGPPPGDSPAIRGSPP